jgi:hypothetical protein
MKMSGICDAAYCTDTVYMPVAKVLTGTCMRVTSGACQHGDESSFKH